MAIDVTSTMPMAVSAPVRPRWESDPMSMAAARQNPNTPANCAACPIALADAAKPRAATSPAPPKAAWLMPWPTNARRLRTTRALSDPHSSAIAPPQAMAGRHRARIVGSARNCQVWDWMGMRVRVSWAGSRG